MAKEENEQKWPDNIVLIRHGQTTINAERERLKQMKSKKLIIDIPIRDMDISLSKEGIKQVEASAEQLKKMPKFDAVFISPYLRCKQTAEIILKKLNYKPLIIEEERIREKDFGSLDKLTDAGIKHFYPREYERREREKKYYYRAPGGENHPDVALRVHSLIGTLVRDYSKKNILIVSHLVVVLIFRRLIERMSEEQVLELDKKDKLKNASITHFAYNQEKNRLLLKGYNKVYY